MYGPEQRVVRFPAEGDMTTETRVRSHVMVDHVGFGGSSGFGGFVVGFASGVVVMGGFAPFLDAGEGAFRHGVVMIAVARVAAHTGGEGKEEDMRGEGVVESMENRRVSLFYGARQKRSDPLTMIPRQMLPEEVRAPVLQSDCLSRVCSSSRRSTKACDEDVA